MLFDQGAHARIVEESLFGRVLARVALTVPALVEGFGLAPADVLTGAEADLRRSAQADGQGSGQVATGAFGTQVLEARRQGQGQLAIGMVDEGAVCGQLPRWPLEFAGGHPAQPVFGIDDPRALGQHRR